MRHRADLTRGLAATLILALPLFSVPISAGVPTASLKGRIVEAGTRAPMAGARIHAGDPKAGTLYSSHATSSDGSFSLDALPASSYELAVESEGGLFAVSAPVQLAAGQSRDVQLAVTRNQAASGAGGATNSKGTGAKLGIWNNPLTATLLVLGGAVVVGVLVDQVTDDDNNASPSAP